MGKTLNRKYLILLIFLLICCVSFSAITGAKYFSQFITVLEDFFSDVKKVLTAIVAVIFTAKGIQAAGGSDANGFMVTLFQLLFIIALAGIAITIFVAVGGATINENILKEMQVKNVAVAEKNIEVLYEIE